MDEMLTARPDDTGANPRPACWRLFDEVQPGRRPKSAARRAPSPACLSQMPDRPVDRHSSTSSYSP